PPNGNGSDHTPRGALATSDAPTREPTTDEVANAAFAGGLTETSQPENGSGPGVDATIADGVPALPADNLRSSRGSRSKDSGGDPGTSPSPADDTQAFSFDRPEAAPVSPGTDDWTAGHPAESSAEDPSPTTPTGPPPSRPGLSGAQPPPVSPAAFAWEMPDPPVSSPSSTARNFLRTGTDTKSPAASGAPAAADSAENTPRPSASASALSLGGP